MRVLIYYGTNIEKERIGNISVFPETDTTILFYVDVNQGAPSYNMGELYGRVKIIDGRGTFYIKLDSSDKGCKWGFKFSKSMLSLKTIGDYFDCGFGNAVFMLTGTINNFQARYQSILMT